MTSGIISKTYESLLTLYRYRQVQNNAVKEKIYENIPCGISRSAYTHSPTPMGECDSFPKKRYRLRVYAQPDIRFHIGDLIEVKRYGEIYKGTASDGFYYDTHSMCIAEIQEVIYDKA